MSLFEGEDIDDIPDRNKQYFCSSRIQSSGTTLLMKWVLLTAKNPNLLNRIRKYIELFPKELNKQNDLGWTALIIAARNSGVHSTDSTVELLLEFGANPDIQIKDGCTALMLAAQNSKFDSTIRTVKLLIDANCDMNIVDTNGFSALMLVANDHTDGSRTESSHIDILQILIEAGRLNINLKDKFGWTALKHAAKYSNCTEAKNKVELLINAGANIDAQDNNGSSALVAAVSFSNTTSSNDTVIQLLDAGAVCNLKNVGGRCALSIAVQNCKSTSSESTIKILLDHPGIDINAPDSAGYTPLMLAARTSKTTGSSLAVQMLIDAGCQVNYCNHKGETALQIAAVHDGATDTPNTVQMLVDAGANPNCFDDTGMNPLMNAIVSNMSKPILEPLITGGTDINALSKFTKKPALSFAIAKYRTNHVIDDDDIKLFKSLISNNIINTRDTDGKTPLVIALKLKKPHMAIIKLLVEAGAKLELAHRKDSHSLIRVLKRGDYELSEYLLSRSLVNNFKYKNNMTFLMFLIERCEKYVIVDVIKTLTLSKLDIQINAQDTDGNTALMQVIKKYKPRSIFDSLCANLVMLLIDADADTLMFNNAGIDALTLAAGYSDTVRILHNYSLGRDTFVPVVHDHDNLNDKDEIDICTICLDDLDDNIVKLKGCGHLYHSGCIGKWLNHNTYCPVCNRVLYVKVK